MVYLLDIFCSGDFKTRTHQRSNTTQRRASVYRDDSPLNLSPIIDGPFRIYEWAGLDSSDKQTTRQTDDTAVLL